MQVALLLLYMKNKFHHITLPSSATSFLEVCWKHEQLSVVSDGDMRALQVKKSTPNHIWRGSQDHGATKEPLQQEVFHLLLQEHRIVFYSKSLQEDHIPKNRAGMQRLKLIKEALERSDSWVSTNINHPTLKVQAEQKDRTSSVGLGAPVPLKELIKVKGLHTSYVEFLLAMFMHLIHVLHTVSEQVMR